MCVSTVLCSGVVWCGGVRAGTNSCWNTSLPVLLTCSGTHNAAKAMLAGTGILSVSIHLLAGTFLLHWSSINGLKASA